MAQTFAEYLAATEAPTPPASSSPFTDFLSQSRSPVVQRAQERQDAERDLNAQSPPRGIEIGPGTYREFGQAPAPLPRQSVAGANRLAAPLEPGNIDLFKQPSVPNPDGTRSTVDSRSFNFDGKEYLLPSVTPDGRHLRTDDEVVAEFRKTGRHLGIFADSDSADAYADQLHRDYAAGKYRPKPMQAELVAQSPVRITEPLSSEWHVGIGGQPEPGPGDRTGGVVGQGIAQVAGAIPPLSAKAGRLLTHPEEAGRPTEETLTQMADVLDGAAKAGTPLLIAGAIIDLPATALTLGASWLAATATERAAQYAEATPAMQRFLGAVAGTATAVGGTVKMVEALNVAVAATAAGAKAAARPRILAGLLRIDPPAAGRQSGYGPGDVPGYRAEPTTMESFERVSERPPSKSALDLEESIRQEGQQRASQAEQQRAEAALAPTVPDTPQSRLESLEAVQPGKSRAVPFPVLLGHEASRLFQAAVGSPLEERTVQVADLVAMQPSFDPTIVGHYLEAPAPLTGKLPIGIEWQGKYHLEDGTHRAVAAWANGDETLTIKVKQADPAKMARLAQEPAPTGVVKPPSDHPAPTIRRMEGAPPEFHAVEPDETPVTDFLNEQALEAARQAVDLKPTEGQKDAGNYQKGHVTLFGLEITIENPRGSQRTGTTKAGTPWSVTMPGDYGYIKRTEGADGDHVDVYIGPNLSADRVFVIDQIDLETGRFDEHKAILGVSSEAEARTLYAQGFSDGRGEQRIGAVTALPVETFKQWSLDGDTSKPLGLIEKVGPSPTQADFDAAMRRRDERRQREKPARAGETARYVVRFGDDGRTVEADSLDHAVQLHNEARDAFEAHAGPGASDLWPVVTVTDRETGHVSRIHYNGRIEPPTGVELARGVSPEGRTSQGSPPATQPGTQPDRGGAPSPPSEKERRAELRRHARARQAEYDAAVERAPTEIIDALVADATTAGYTGDPESLRTELRDRLALIDELDRDFETSGHNPRAFLEAIARYGGIRNDDLSDIETEGISVKGAKFGRVGGVNAVFTKQGLTWDLMREALGQEARFGHIESIRDVQEAIKDAIRAKDEGIPADRLKASLGERWWETLQPVASDFERDLADLRADEGDIDFDPETLEAQPRLPEAGQVRNQEVKTPQFEAPFSLTGEAAQTTAVEPSLFEDAPSRHEEQTKGGSPSGGGGEASSGLFVNPAPTTAASIQPVAFPELVDLARELLSTPSVVKAFRGVGTRGMFRHGGLTGGQIQLHGDLFKKGNEGQLVATLAHEIGHLVDWLPHQTLKRGNILGRLFSLRAFLKHTFVASDGSHITNKEIRGELTALSNKWRPWDPEKVSASFAAYRKSSKEIFADAISVLLNDPALLEKDAPIFFEQFFNELDRKPDVKRAYFDLQTLLAGTPEALTAKRRAGVQEMFTVGDTKAMDLERLRQAERKASLQDLWLRTRIQFVDKNTPIIDRVRALQKRGVVVNPDDDPRYFLEERNYLGGKLKAFTERHFQPVHTALVKADIDWHTFGEALFYDRIIAGDRSELANPRGISPDVAETLRVAMSNTLTTAQRTVLHDSIDRFRAAVTQVAEDAYAAGLYTDALHDQIKDNPAYVSFRVLDHIERDVTSRVYKQIGTLKDITNPADATMLKTLVTIRAIEHQKMKVAVFDFLQQHFPGDIAQAQEIGSPKGRRPIESTDKQEELITYYEKGKLRGKYVEPYIADSLNNVSVGHNLAIVSVLRFINSTVFRPVFTTFNVGFQSFNFGRDFLRTWKNAPGMSLAKIAQRYVQARHLARVRAFGLPAKPSVALKRAHEDLLDAETNKMLSVTMNDLNAGREVQDTQIEETLSKMGLGGFQPTPTSRWGKVLTPLKAVLGFIEHTGNFIETLPKAAVIYQFKGQGSIADIPADQRSLIRRKIGSPDFLAGGTFKPITNELFLFSNAITQAIRADVEVATDSGAGGGGGTKGPGGSARPGASGAGRSPRAAFWWKTAALNILPKIMMFAALLALAHRKKGDEEQEDDSLDTLRRTLEGISEYDQTNYTNIPLGLDAQGHSIYLRLPQDDFGRLIGGLAWKALRIFRGDKDVVQTAMQVLDYTSGQFPGLTPTLTGLSDIAQFAAGRNVYDPFRSRFLFTDDELKAGGRTTAQKFVGYEFQQLGGGIVWKFYPGEQRPLAKTPGQRILDLPVLSNVIGRWLRISDLGQIERLRSTQGKVQREEARTRLTERSAVNDAIRTYRDRPTGQQTPALQATMARDIVTTLYADQPPAERSRQYKDVVSKIRLGLVRQDADPLTDVVMSATSNAQKTALIVTAAEGMSKADLAAWMNVALQEKVISPAVRFNALKALGR